MNKILLNEFDWSKYDEDYSGGNNLTLNQKIIGQTNKSKCFSREPYAQKMFDLFTSGETKIVKKDLVKGDCVPITGIYSIKDNKISIELSGGLTIDVDLDREKKFIQLFGYTTIDEFIEILKNKNNIDSFLNQGLYAYITEASPSIKVSLWQGYLKKIKEEFMKEIISPSKAYVAKIIETNKGGYFVEVQGVEAFMPGSLAAPNKIIDFNTLIGKEVIVMIEDFLVEMNSFIVSHKKYVEHVLPKKIQELDLNNKYSGSITGTSKYGIFVEFEDIFTGLLHVSKMSQNTKEKFALRLFKPGDIIEFYINEITKDNRIILTEESPQSKQDKFNNFLEENKNKEIEGKIAAIMTFGIIVNVGEISGLIPLKNLKKNNIIIKNYNIGDSIKFKIFEFKNDKLIFEL